jgi:4-oxalomesaconate tautomerase
MMDGADPHEAGVPCMLMRGGTSKGLYLLRDDLPGDTAERDELLRRLLGSPDGRQIDGLGGAHPLTSKVAVVTSATDEEADLDYLFLQVGVDDEVVTDRQNCGNLLAGVGPFGVERGLVHVTDDQARVRIRMLNTGGIAVATFPVRDGRPRYDGDTAISGAPGTAARIDLDFEGTAGGTCGALLPTGRSRDVIEDTPVTCVDNGMPVVLLPATALDITGHETCEELEADVDLRARLEAIRLAAGPLMGLGDVTSTTVPKLTILAPPADTGDISTRTFIPHRCHTSIGVLGAVSVATGCLVPGSVGDELLRPREDPGAITLEHPTGTITTTVQLDRDGDQVTVQRAGIVRTARKLMDGTAFPRPADARGGP